MTPTGIALLIATVFGALFVGAYAFLAIVYIRFVRHWTPLVSRARVIEQGEIAPEVWESMGPSLDALGGLGFEHLGFLEVVSRPDCAMHLAVTRSAAGHELGLVTVRSMILLGRPCLHPILHMHSEAANGLSIETNSTHIGELHEIPSGETWCLGGVLDAALLVRFHRAACGPDRRLKPLDPLARGLVEWHRRQESEAMQDWVRTGEPELNRDATEWRLTYRAAFRMMFRALPPGPWVRRARHERRLRPIFRRAGITNEDLARARARSKPGHAPAL